MIANNNFNRDKILEYLENVTEDQLIEQVVIPLFSKNGFYLFRKNTHGPGEHGKDLIFYRDVKLFYSSKYIVVQAKAEKVTTGNVTKFADQMIRSFKIPFPSNSRGHIYANYAYFINSKAHTNDVNFEFHHLADLQDNVKIIDGDRTCELMIEFDIIPEILKGKIEEYHTSPTNTFEDIVISTILSNDNNAINKLLDYDLKVYSGTLSTDTQKLIINYIFLKWDEDRSWEGTVKPMKWLREYFEYLQPDQYHKLKNVINEYVSSNPSFTALADVQVIVERMTPEQLSSFQKDFVDKLVLELKSYRGIKHPLMLKKFEDLQSSGLLSTDFYNVSNHIEAFLNAIKVFQERKNDEDIEILRAKIREADTELHYYMWPEDRE